ncbi:3245_t:CDS:2 [Acaulospora colombiana]|uniref:3245_t:CDS:1 n=1 Tax=Acaulospora colombiana TaxID=27376 RepID=A0ACA9MVU1_9GLOM|nr:3245_t:CDS:2 [Acaulospora colombiana]
MPDDIRDITTEFFEAGYPERRYAIIRCNHGSGDSQFSDVEGTELIEELAGILLSRDEEIEGGARIVKGKEEGRAMDIFIEEPFDFLLIV